MSLIELDPASIVLFQKIREKSQEVFTILGKGYPENVYQKALGIEFQHLNIHYDMEVTMSIPYKEHVVGQVRADMIVRGEIPVIIETKSTAANIKLEERWQLSRYMKILDISLGALINFAQTAGKLTLQIEFLVKDEDTIYLYDLDANTGAPLG